MIDKVYEFASKTRTELFVANAELLRGLLSREQKNWEQSIKHFEKCLQTFRSPYCRR